MKFNKENAKVVVNVLHADEIIVNFLHKPRFMSWREMTQRELQAFAKVNYKWTISLEVKGTDDRVDEHEIAVSTPILFTGANDVFREILESVQELWPGKVIAKITAVFLPGL